MRKVFAYLNRFYPLSNGLRNYLVQVMKHKEIPRNNFLLQEGEICKAAWYLEKGLVRCFYDNNAHETTTWFVPEDNAVLEAKSLFEQLPSGFYIEALENCITWMVDYASIQYALEHYPEAKEIRTRITDWYSNLKDVRIKTASLPSAMERYRYFEKHFDHLLGRLKLKHIASYLDMDIRTLTKARKNSRNR